MLAALGHDQHPVNEKLPDITNVKLGSEDGPEGPDWHVADVKLLQPDDPTKKPDVPEAPKPQPPTNVALKFEE
jgi:hypothetical protein